MSKKFRRHNSHALKRVSASWRKPRGTDNKVRYGFRGYVNRVRVGYGTPSKSNIVLVSNLGELEKLTGSDATIIFSSTLGKRKKLDLIKKADELNLKIKNVADDFVSKVEENLKSKKAVKAEKIKAKEAKKAELDKRSKEAKKKAKTEKTEEKTEEEKKTEAKKEKDKILTQKA